MRKWQWRRIVSIGLILIGVLLIAFHYWPGVQVWLNQKDVAITNVTSEQIRENADKKVDDAEFDTNNVRTVTPRDVEAARERIKNGEANLNVIGALAFPKQKVSVSVMTGLSEAVLLSGVGTFYPNQKMGENNYPLAAHNMSSVGPHLLLQDIINNTELGDKIYLTDLNTIYVYEVYFAEAVDPSRIDLVALNQTDPATHKPIVTVQTCTDDGTLRYIVQGKLVDKVPFDQANQEMISAFK